MKTTKLLRENLRISFQSIRSNLLRTVLTILIIAIGITALVGILTAIESIRNSISTEFTRMGANTFSIESRGMSIQIGKHRERTKNYSFISYRQAQEFKQMFDFPATVSVSVWATGTGTLKYQSEKTHPNVRVMGVDENFLLTAGHEIAQGRNFSANDIEDSRNIAILGSKVVSRLFGENTRPVGEIVSVGGSRYKVVGVLKERGSSFGFDDDNMCIIPYTNVRQYFSRPQMNYTINVMPADATLLDIATSEAEGIFRVVRNLSAADESDFHIKKSDNLADMLIENIQYVTLAATIIGIITLLGAAIGLMNIMLVAVSERTREIGIRKAIGATSTVIKQQFLFESIIIGQLGGALGIVFGILIGNMVSLMIGSPFIVPWGWILGGVLLCFIVGVVSGLFPAIKASKLDPITALRYE